MSDNSFEELGLLLSKQLEVQRKLLALETDKTKILVSGNLEKLDEILKQQAPLILSCDSLENRRKQLLSKMGFENLTLQQILAESAPQQRAILENSFNDLSQVLLQLRKINSRNKKILQCRLVGIKQCLSFIGCQDDSPTYDQDGHF